LTKSDTISELAKALCKAQGAIQPAIKDAENPFFHSTYADLSSVWEVARKPLADNGLSVSQLPGECRDNKILLKTILMHESGEFLSSTLEMPYLKSDPQAIGSAITYARRYALAAIVGIVADEDDDANKAAGKGQESPKETTKKVKEEKTGKVVSASPEIRAKLHQELEEYCKFPDGVIDKPMYLSTLKDISKFGEGDKEKFITDVFAIKSDQGQTISEKWINACIGKLRERTKKEASRAAS
jgi:hypothetical protein